MLYSFIMYADVVFPLKISPLTYKVPKDAQNDLKGRIVKAPLMGKAYYGLVISVTEEAEIKEKKNIKEILNVHCHFASESTLLFLKWLSDYYLMPMGIALKSSLFEEAVKIAVSRLSQSPTKNFGDKKIARFFGDFDHQSNQQVEGLAVKAKNNEQKIEAENSELLLIYNCIKNKNYKSFLYHASSMPEEYFLLNEVLDKCRLSMHGAIIIVPEISQIEGLAPMLKNIFDERVCVLHSNLTKKKRIDAIERIVTGQSDVILGTRSAMLAPIRNISFIAVLNEHNPSYKGEEGLRYNARDAAVMRGFIEKSCVLLSSICPSAESIYNAKIGKYTTLVSSQQADLKRPKIKIVDIKKENASTISKDIFKEAKNIVSKGGRFLFLVNKKGYSLIRCEDCGHIAQCNKCGISLVFYKGKNIVRCHYCSNEEVVIESCRGCRGFNIKPVGAGIERIKEELERALKINAFLIEKTKGISKTLTELPDDFTSFIVGTTYATKKIRDKKLDAIAIFNTDGLLAQPDFRAYERAFQEVMQISQMVKTEGFLYLQTWNPKNKILRFIKNYDFQGFYKNELTQRKSLDYPPFSRIILFNIFVKKDADRLLHDIQKIIYHYANINGLELLGPTVVPTAMKLFIHSIQILLKSKDRKMLHETAKRLLKEIEGLKDIKIKIDVDPLKI